jgi:DNA-binding NarL/FixJ family response regulator
MKRVPIGIVEDNRDIRLALQEIIQLSNDYELVASSANGEAALEEIPLAKPRVVLMDINLGGIDGIEVVRVLKQAQPDILFMMCTVYEDDDKIFEALKAGASGYILKKTTPSKLLEAIKELHLGGAPMSSQIARKVVETFQLKPNLAKDEKYLQSLTKREKEILEMLSKGMRYREISEHIYVSQETVRKHVYHIYEKLHVSNKVEAINKYFGR